MSPAAANLTVAAGPADEPDAGPLDEPATDDAVCPDDAPDEGDGELDPPARARTATTVTTRASATTVATTIATTTPGTPRAGRRRATSHMLSEEQSCNAPVSGNHRDEGARQLAAPHASEYTDQVMTYLMTVEASGQMGALLRLLPRIPINELIEREPGIMMPAPGDHLLLKFPDGTNRRARLGVFGVEVWEKHGEILSDVDPNCPDLTLSIAGDLEPKDVPAGTEVWLTDVPHHE